MRKALVSKTDQGKSSELVLMRTVTMRTIQIKRVRIIKWYWVWAKLGLYKVLRIRKWNEWEAYLKFSGVFKSWDSIKESRRAVYMEKCVFITNYMTESSCNQRMRDVIKKNGVYECIGRGFMLLKSIVISFSVCWWVVSNLQISLWRRDSVIGLLEFIWWKAGRW